LAKTEEALSWIPAGSLAELKEKGHKVVQGGIAVFWHENQVYAVDNRCPHMGFPLHLGSLCDGILTCHWHHARFALCGGGALDPWADDVPSHEVRVENGEIWVNPKPRRGTGLERHRSRLREGLEQNIGLAIAKAIVGLIESGASAGEIVAAGLEHGLQYGSGWNAGLTILTAMARVLPQLDREGQILALYQGMLHVSRGAAGRPERHLLGALPDGPASAERLAAWYRRCVEVRDTQGAERVLLTAIERGLPDKALADMMFAAATDHMYLDGGHTLDFHNKAFEAMAFLPPERKKLLLTSLVPLLARPSRAEESHPWQSPVNLVEPIRRGIARLEAAAGAGAETLPGTRPLPPERETDLFRLLLEDRPLDTFEALTASLLAGDSPAGLARVIALAAAERIVRFHTQNDFRDWIAVLHTFTHANAVYAALRRAPSLPLARALYHAAAAVYLDRFLNVPAARRPSAEDGAAGEFRPEEFLAILDSRQQVSEAARWAMPHLRRKERTGPLLNVLGHALLREDADFHTFQMYEGVVSQLAAWEGREDAFAETARETLLLAAVRYLAAQAPTPRETPHTARIAVRLHRGEALFEEK